MSRLYEVVFYIGEEPFPAYHLIDTIECESIEDELKNRLAHITQRVRRIFGIGGDIPDWKIYESLYALEEDGLIPVKNMIVTMSG